jgi:excisionase family DNA binding protein
MSPTVDVRGAADLMKVHPKTVLDLTGAGALPAGRVGRAYVLLTRDVMRFIEQQVVSQTAERMEGLKRRKRGPQDWRM